MAFLEGIKALDPPDDLVDFHEYAFDQFSRLIVAEEALAARVATYDAVIEHWSWWDTSEGRAAQAVDDETAAICYAAQEYLDATQQEQDEPFKDVPWIPVSRREVVRVAFGCPE